MLDKIVAQAPVFLLVAVRCLGLLFTLPLFSSEGIPRVAKIALAGYMSYFIFPQVSLNEGTFSRYAQYVALNGNFSLEYILLLIGEALLGIIMGFYMNVIFAAFSTAGQFFAFQMGFSSSVAYDALSQVENPLMGQMFNLVALLIFMQNNWFQKIFLGGLVTSFNTLNAFSIVFNTQSLMKFLLGGLTALFKDALIISLPIMGSLFLVNLTMGILTKAAPQMNLMSEGFSILILFAFYILMFLMPILCNFFNTSFEQGFKQLQIMFMKLSPGAVP